MSLIQFTAVNDTEMQPHAQHCTAVIGCASEFKTHDSPDDEHRGVESDPSWLAASAWERWDLFKCLNSFWGVSRHRFLFRFWFCLCSSRLFDAGGDVMHLKKVISSTSAIQSTTVKRSVMTAGGCKKIAPKDVFPLTFLTQSCNLVGCYQVL